MAHLALATLGAIVLLSSPSLARADAAADFAEPAERDEKQFRRDGFAIGVGLGSALLLGAGTQRDVRGGGGALAIRVGTSAGDKLLWFAQLDAASRSDASVASLLTVAAHYYVRDAVWLRGGLGFGSIARPVETSEGDTQTQADGGLAIVAGAGVDVFQRGIFAVDLELALSRTRAGGGSMSVASLQLATTWY